ncbi:MULTISPECIES: hypothetical protein [Agrobacterium]|uniref:acylneuraminate cytidylyltransferase family protein n=1 Tax=Agrobacterium TaxID=357 RepID=UPI000DE029D6|nr:MULTISPECIES: hypothetical protein [Agrobacterium]MDP9856660.1 CMP-N-acetylneuraminic acid synthetase [Agrobacterium tumefaciens]
MTLKIAAIIPARAGSVRVKAKNLQKIGALSLVERKVDQLQQSKYVTDIVLGTNCPDCIEIGRRRRISILERDEYHCDEARVSANEMIHDLASRLDADIVIWSHCTNPFLYARHYDVAIERFLDGEKLGFDSLLSVQKVQSHMWNKDGHPENYDPYAKKHTLAKYIDPVFFQDGGIFIQRREDMVNNSYFFGSKPQLFQVDFPFAHDINTESDLEIAREMASWLDSKERFSPAA